MLDVKSLCQKANISQQTFYRLIRENKEFSSLVENNRQKKGNGYKYDTPVLEWLYNYYDREQAEAEQEQATESPVEAPASPVEGLDGEERIKTLLEENTALHAQIDDLKQQLEDKEQERRALFAQNAQLILLLGQEKQEKQALLPAPRKPIGERIKALFSRKDKEQPT